jgi:hypothetical protein
MKIDARGSIAVSAMLIILSLVPPGIYFEKTNYDPMNNCPSQGLAQKEAASLTDIDKNAEPTIKKLEWRSPQGELPGTYTEYLKTHPLSPAEFTTPLYTKPLNNVSYCNLSILVDKDLYPKILSHLQTYIEDLTSEGVSVNIQEISGGYPQEIRTWIKTRYNRGDTGFVFVGDITAAWAEVSGSVFPCDLFYMDVDGTWEDQDLDGDFETHIPGDGDLGPEVYVARIFASSLSFTDETTLVNEYLDKVHDYRTGMLQQPWQGLEYVEEDWYDMPVDLGYIYGENVTRYDYGYFTTASDYQEKIREGQHFVTVCAHSYSGGHYFGTRPTESVVYANSYIYSPLQQHGYLFMGCDDGIKTWLNGEMVYTNDRYGAWRKDNYHVEITLEKGWNQLLCKISQEGGEFKFSARFTNQDFEPIEGLIYQINNPLSHTKEAEYVRCWLLNGFYQDTSDRFWDYLLTNYLGIAEDSINPHEGEETGGNIWERYDSGNPYVDINEYSDESDFGVCYAFSRVYADSNKDCQLWLGYDDGIRVWLNGNVVFFDNRYGDFTSDMVKVNVTLRSGENRLLVKVSEWMGENGFTAKYCSLEGGSVEGLTYDPEMAPVSWIGKWLVNGPYLNPDMETRLTWDYLEGEDEVQPSMGDPASEGVWETYIGNGCPVNLGRFYDSGDWVTSEDIQECDPPVLFYNLFACGPGRFTDDNYLAGAYIFNTTHGLITVASSKSGSMLNFADFTHPLSEGDCIGEAFRRWFDAQAPFQQWEKEWYYGMVICGDPTLVLLPPARIVITKPQEAIYFKNKMILPFFTPIILGDIDIEVTPYNLVGILSVEIYLDDILKAKLSTSPYTWKWEKKNPLQIRYTLSARAYTTNGNIIDDTVQVWRFF